MSGSFDWNVLPILADLTLDEMKISDRPNYNFSEDMIPRPSEIVSILLVIGNVLVLVFAVCGGLATLILCTRSKFARPATKFLLISMAASDCILAISSILPSMTALLDKYTSWTLGRFFCHIGDYTPAAAMLVNGFCLIAIAVDRYLAVVRCVKSSLLTPKWSSVLVGLGMILIWAVPMAICFPLLYGYSLERFWIWNNGTSDGVNHYFCWKEDWYMRYDKWHNLALCLLFFSLVTTFVFAYASILRFLKKNFHTPPTTTMSNNKILKSSRTTAAPPATTAPNTKSLSIQTLSQLSDDRMSESTKNGGATFSNSSEASAPPSTPQPIPTRLERQRRTVKLIMLLIGLFLVCRLPVWIYHLVSIMDPKFPYNSTTLSIRYTLLLLSNLKCAINPFIYTLKNDALKSQDGNRRQTTTTTTTTSGTTRGGTGYFGWKRGCCYGGTRWTPKNERWSQFLRCYANWRWQKSPTSYDFKGQTNQNQIIQRPPAGQQQGSTTFVYGQ